MTPNDLRDLCSLDNPPKFTALEERVLRDLERKFVEKGEWEAWPVATLIEDSGVNKTKWQGILARFQGLGILKREAAEADSKFYIKAPVCEHVSRLEHKPPRNFWNEWAVWWFSSRWRSAIFALVVLIPALWKWVELCKAARDCFPIPFRQ